MTNEKIRTRLFINEVRQWELAQELKVSEPYLTKILRKELEGEQLDRVLNAIDSIISRKAGQNHVETR